METIPWHVAALIGEAYPLRSAEAGQAMRAHLARVSDQAEQDGLTEADVTRMLNAAE